MWKASLTFAYGEFRTSHVATCPDVAPECAQITIPDHEHRVELGLFHTDLWVGYGVSERLSMSARLPYESKAMEVNYRTLEGGPYDPPYGDIHHRTETLRGVADAEILASYALGRDWSIGGGLTVPLGDTVPDPIDLGRRGVTHQHIQFGSGTVDPRLAIQWSRLIGRVQLTAAADARIPLYESSEGWRAPATVRWSVGPNVSIGTTGISASWAGQYQSIGKWNGETDEGTGFHNGGVFVNASFFVPKIARVSAGVYFEAYSHSLTDESFEQEPAFSLVISRFFQ